MLPIFSLLCKRFRYNLHGLIAILGSTLLTGCLSTPQTKQLTHHTNHAFATTIEHSQTPFYSQQRFHCGPSALATAMDVAGTHQPYNTIAKKVYLPGRKGSLPTDLIGATRRFGLVAYKLKPSLNDLLTELSHGNVVIVFQNLGVKWIPRWHYAVAIGYNLNNKTIILRSGKHKRRVTKLKLFERTWKRSGYWAMVVTPVTRIPKTANAVNWLSALNIYEKQNKTSKLISVSYTKSITRWPNDSLLHMAFGNYWYRHKRYSKAAPLYRKASKIDPSNGDAWNNLANLMLQKKRYKLARQYSLKAVAAGGRNLKIYQLTLKQIEKRN